MDQKKKLLTVVGVSGLDPAKDEVKIGNILYFEKEVGNPDPFAIRVFTNKGGSAVGYVANAKTTVLPGTLSAKNAHGSIGDGAFGTIIGADDVVFRNGQVSTGFIVELHLTDLKGDVSMENVIKFKLVGATSQYPNKQRMLNDFKNGKQPYVELSVKDDKIVAEYEGDLSGYVDVRNQDGLSDYQDIITAVGEKKVAKIIQSVATNVIGEIRVDVDDMKKLRDVNTFKMISQQIVQDGLITESEIQERISYMQNCGVAEKQMLRVFESYKPYREEIASLIPDMKFPKVLYKDGGEGIVMDCVSYMNGNRNLLFEGDRGVGKNVLIETLAWLYKRPLYEFAVNSQHDNNSLLGGKTIETDEDGKSKMGFDVEATVKAAIEGGVLNLDEINSGLAHALIIFNSLLDDRRRMTIPGYGTVQAHENFVVIGSMNRDYQGTFELNEATADRFVPIIFPALKSLKQVLMAKIPQVGLPIINQCESLYTGLKKVVFDGEVSDKAISIRGFLDACIGVDEGLPLKRTLITNVANRCTDKDDRNAVMNLINALIR
jgi:hypothetical protein